MGSLMTEQLSLIHSLQLGFQFSIFLQFLESYNTQISKVIFGIFILSTSSINSFTIEHYSFANESHFPDSWHV